MEKMRLLLNIRNLSLIGRSKRFSLSKKLYSALYLCSRNFIHAGNMAVYIHSRMFVARPRL